MKRALGQLWVQVLIGMAVGIAIGVFAPGWGSALKPLADGFVKLIKMLLAPIIFGTVAVGIARMGDLKEVGRIGLKALIYFEALSTIALLLGLLVGNLLHPGAGMNVDAAALDPQSVQSYAAAGGHGGIVSFLLGIIPDSFLGALTGGSMLQVILIALLAGFALSAMRERGAALTDLIDQATAMMFRIVGIVMWLAPIGAGAGIAFTIGTYGVGSLAALLNLMIALFLTTILFVVVVLGLVMRFAGLRLWSLLRFIKDEILVTLGTCSTEAVLPQVMRKMEEAGVDRPVVGLVLPTGYTFNTDGTSIYLTMATIFIAQATNTPLSIGDQITVLLVLLLTSKGSAGVAGAGFVALAATLGTIPALPVAGLVLIVGIDRFLNEARAVTNLIGNCVATLAVARWDGALDMAQARRVLNGEEAPAA
jgi:aerobic C4-dicarboxylate transport protein